MTKILLTVIAFLPPLGCLTLLAEQDGSRRQTVSASPAKFVAKDGLGDPLPEPALARCGTTRMRHLGLSLSVSWLSDGRGFAAAGDTSVTFFDAATGKQSTPPAPVRDARHPIRFSPDGKWVAYESFESRGYKLILERLGQREGRTAMDTGLLSSLAFSADGSYLAAAISDKGGVILIDLKTRAVKARWQFSTTVDPSDVALSPDGKYLAAGGGLPDPSEENDVQVWDTTAEKVVARLKGHHKRVMSLAFVSGGSGLASAGFDDTIRFWDLEKKAEVGSINTPALALSVSPDGKTLASADRTTGAVYLWDQARRKKLREFSTGDQPVYSLAFSPDGKRLLTSGYTSNLRLWDVGTGKDVLPLPGHQDAVMTVAFSPDGKSLASRGFGNTVRLWDPATGKEQRRFTLSRWLQAPGAWGRCGLAYSPDGSKLAVLSGNDAEQKNYELSLCDVHSGKVTAAGFSLPPRFQPHTMAFAPDGNVVALSGRDGVRVWSLSSGKEVRHIPSDMRRWGPGSIAFSPDGRLLAMGQPRRPNEDKLEVWDWSAGVPIRTMLGQDDHVTGLAFSPGGQLLASCGSAPADAASRLWEVASGTFVRAFAAHDEGGVGGIAVSPDTRLVATGGIADHTVRVWNAFTGDELARFKGHIGPVTTVAFSPDGKRLASGSADTTILIWDVSHLKGTPPATDTDPDNLRKLWDTLRRHDAAKPYEALWSLVGAGDKAVALFDKELRPFPAPDADKLRQLLADLDNNDPDRRDKASEELAKLGPLAEPALREAGKATRSAEVRRRVDDLLGRLRARRISEDELRQGRALLALELIDTPAARDLLRRLGEGAAGAPLTRDAKAALRRLNK